MNDEDEDDVNDVGVEQRPLPPRLEAQQNMVEAALRAAASLPINGGTQVPTPPLAVLNDTPPAPTPALPSMSSSFPPALPPAFLEFYTRASDPTAHQPVVLELPGMLTLQLHVSAIVSNNNEAVTLLLPLTIEVKPVFEVVYKLVLNRKVYKAMWGGVSLQLPGFPWRILTFVTSLEDDQTRRSQPGQSLMSQRETFPDHTAWGGDD